MSTDDPSTFLPLFEQDPAEELRTQPDGGEIEGCKPESGFATFPLFSEDLGPPMKRCGRCHEIKPLSEFYKNKNQRLGVYDWCKLCSSSKRKELLKTSQKHRESRKLIAIKYRYGIDRHTYKMMLEDQDYACGMCGEPSDRSGKRGRLYVDHCHITGRVRMLLCSKCNTAIGLLNDDPTMLRKAAEYIERFRDQATD